MVVSINDGVNQDKKGQVSLSFHYSSPGDNGMAFDKEPSLFSRTVCLCGLRMAESFVQICAVIGLRCRFAREDSYTLVWGSVVPSFVSGCFREFPVSTIADRFASIGLFARRTL